MMWSFLCRHEDVFDFQPTRLAARCLKCGRVTPGWEIKDIERPLPTTVPAGEVEQPIVTYQDVYGDSGTSLAAFFSRHTVNHKES